MTSDVGQFNRRTRGQSTLGRAEVVAGGTEGNNVPDDFSIPSVGIRDVDKALFDAFDTSFNLQVSTRNQTKQVPVVFAGGERYALTKSGRPIRDRSGAVKTPIVAIHRTGMTLGADPGMAFGTDTGDIVVYRRLAAEDRNYQQLVNRFGVENQDNVASDANVQQLSAPRSIAQPGKVGSRRVVGGLPLQSALDNPLTDNIVEVITMPTPNFITLRYTATFWTSFQGEMNQLVERVMACYDIGGMWNNSVKIQTDKGYWFVAYFDQDWTMDDNFTDYTTQKRLIKSSVSINVPAWTFAAAGPGDPSPARRFLSAPQFDFDVCEVGGVVESLATQMPMLGPEDPAFMLRDVEAVPVDGRVPDVDLRDSIASREYIANPFATSQVDGRTRYARVVCRTAKGERVGRVTDAVELQHITKP